MHATDDAPAAKRQQVRTSGHLPRSALAPTNQPPMASAPSAPASAAVKAAVVPIPPVHPPSSVAVLARRAPTPVPAALRALGGRGRGRGAALVASAALDDLRPAIDEYPEGILSGEWPGNFSLLSYADLRAYLESRIVTSDQVPADTSPFFLSLLIWDDSVWIGCSWLADEPGGKARGRDVAPRAGGHAGAAPRGGRCHLRRGAVLGPACGRRGRQVRWGDLQEGQGQGAQWGRFTDCSSLLPVTSFYAC